MTIEMYENKVLWVRDGAHRNGGMLPCVKLCEGPTEELISIINSLGSPIDLDEDQFFEMIRAGAAHFGKKLIIEDIPMPCPYCGSTVFEYNNAVDQNHVQKFCERCFLSGPVGTGKIGADLAWDKVFGSLSLRQAEHPQDASAQLQTFTGLEKELARR